MLAGRARRQKLRQQRMNSGNEKGGPQSNTINRVSYRPRPQAPPSVDSSDDDDALVATFRTKNSARNNSGGTHDSKDKKKTKNPKNPIQRKRSNHLADTSTKERYLENDAALLREVERLEQNDSQWKHPMGFNLMSALRVLNAPFDPVLNNTGYWIQPEELEDISAMFDSYLNVNCLYYSLAGVLAIETSLYLPNPPPDAPTWVHWLLTISRFCWAANGIWSMAAVVASFHILWSVYATPSWAKRRFVFDNSRTISFVYAMGAPSFALMMIGNITGTMGNVFTQPWYTKKDWISAAAGLGLGATVSGIFVLCSGSLLVKVVRPWKVADENLRKQKRKWSQETGLNEENFFDNLDKANEDQDGDLVVHDVDSNGFGPLEMPFVAQKLCKAGLTMEMLQRVQNENLLDELLEGSGVNRAGDRLNVILFIRDSGEQNSPSPKGKTDWS